MDHCSSCNAEIIWCRTAKGKMQPVDAAESESGNLVIENGMALVVAKDDLRYGGVPRHMPHHATCPQGRQWKKK